jgi:20S proteasome alpha/beta subunit
MTIVVWDGSVLAADKQATTNDLVRKVTKIRRIRGNLVAVSGDWDRGQEVFDWYESGAEPEKMPAFQKTDDFVGLLVITPDKRILKYERSHVPMDFSEEDWFCMGSGRDYAYGALYMGATAPIAVMAASAFSSSCGHGVDILTLEEVSK